MEIIAPSANLIGKAWHGIIPIGSLTTESIGGTVSFGSVSIAQMIRLAKSIDNVHHKPFSIHTSVCNNDLVFSHAHDVNDIGEEHSAEYIEYLIIQRGA